MRFATFETSDGQERFGFLTSAGLLADLNKSYAAYLNARMPSETAYQKAASLVPNDALTFVQAGDACLEAARLALTFIEDAVAKGITPTGPSGETILFAQSEVRFSALLPRPGKIICAGKNFVEHIGEVSSSANVPQLPVAFPKLASVLIGHEGHIPYPEETSELDYEVEMAVIIGKPAWQISKEQASEYIFGYTIINDISARDISRAENQQGVFLLAKNFPGFGPMGPFMVTQDEIHNPQGLRLKCRVNGEIRQASTLNMMLFKIDELIAYWSQIGLDPGDMITTGTPAGAAAGRKKNESPWWLRVGDVVEAEVENLGVLRNFIG